VTLGFLGSWLWYKGYPVPEHMSSTNVHDEGALIAAAELYYRDQLSQQEVAQRLGVSRSTVSRMLQLARDEGIVQIEIRRPSSPQGLSESLRTLLGLRRAVVVPASSRSGLRVIVDSAIEELARLELAPGDALAVSWGSTVAAIAASRQLPPLHGVHVIPAIAAFDEPDGRFQTNEIARRIAELSGAELHFVHGPAMPSPRLRRTLLADEEVSRRLGLWDRLTAALVGIGPPTADVETAPAHVLAARADLAPAAGDVVSRYFDIDGRSVPFEDEKLLLGMSREQLRNTGTVVGVAAGAAKGPSIVGAARAGLIDVLVTDDAAARAALAQAHPPE
jgi:DNA-binding transcriptional regulator LsrR (DeoR family)